MDSTSQGPQSGNQSRFWMRAFVLWAWSIAMTAVTLVLGGVPLKALRRGLGRWPYLALGFGTSAGLYTANLKFLGVAYLSLVILIELFSEWEDLQLSLIASAFFSLLINTLLSGAGLAIWISQTGANWSQVLQDRLTEWLKPAVDLSPSLQLNAYDVLLQIPSIVIVVWLAVLYLAVLLERRLTPPFKAEETPARNGKFLAELNSINLPTGVVWVFVLALAGAFGESGIANLQAVSVNVLNVCLMLFFFQGLAIIFRFFQVFRVGFIWQALLMVIVIGQLFLLVSLLGIVDHWVDFRTRLSKRREEMNKELQ
jgi:hypothetical protein